MKHIVFFSSHLRIGGMEKALVCLLNRLSEKYRVDLVLEQCDGELLSELSKNITVSEFSLSSFNFPPFRKIHNFSKRLLWSVFNRNKYDFSCSYSTYSPLCAKLALIASKNNALYIHSNYCKLYDDDNNLKDFFDSIELLKFKNKIFVSNESRNSLIKVFPEIESTSQVINNLVNGDEIISLAELNDDVAFSKEDINLLFLGRLDNSSKNFKLLIETIKEITDKKLKLYIVGDGPDKQMLFDLIKTNGMSDRVIPVGQKENPYPLLKACDGIILTSYYEGFPVVYLESLVLGKKIFTTVPTSDGIIDIRNSAVILTYDACENAKIICDAFSENTVQKFDYEIYNNKILKNIYEIIGA